MFLLDSFLLTALSPAPIQQLRQLQFWITHSIKLHQIYLQLLQILEVQLNIQLCWYLYRLYFPYCNSTEFLSPTKQGMKFSDRSKKKKKTLHHALRGRVEFGFVFFFFFFIFCCVAGFFFSSSIPRLFIVSEHAQWLNRGKVKKNGRIDFQEYISRLDNGIYLFNQFCRINKWCIKKKIKTITSIWSYVSSLYELSSCPYGWMSFDIVHIQTVFPAYEI